MCIIKNCILVSSFIYINSLKTKLHLKCNNDNHEWFPSYNKFINSTDACPIYVVNFLKNLKIKSKNY
jgi:hypothetical protein